VIRIGCVPYLNAKVLTYGMPLSTPDYALEFHTPSVLVRKLRLNELDIALVSSIEYFRTPAYAILPDLSITGYREMNSVRLFHRGPLKNARRIALDPASETSNALLQIILHEKLGLGIDLVRIAQGEDPLQHSELDGFLKIGDPCLTFVPPADYEVLDLVGEWNMFTNLPFVFAVWLARQGVDLRGLNKQLFLAKREGLRHVEDIARAEGPVRGLDVTRAKNYISKIVHYDLGRAELGGLGLFRRYLVRQSLAPDGRNFDFYTR